MFDKRNKEQSLLEELRETCVQINSLKTEINRIEKLPNIPISWRVNFNYLPNNQEELANTLIKIFNGQANIKDLQKICRHEKEYIRNLAESMMAACDVINNYDSLINKLNKMEREKRKLEEKLGISTLI
jgi:hypothetical protein